MVIFAHLIITNHPLTNCYKPFRVNISKIREKKPLMNNLGYTILLILFLSISNLYAKDSNPESDLSLNKLITFAGYIEASIENENPSYFNNSFDIDAFINNIVYNEQYELSAAFKQGFVDELKNGLDFGASIVDEISKGGSYEYLNAYFEEDKGEVLFRLLTPQTINYHKIEIRFIDNEPRITDIYVFQSGEKLSESIGRLYSSFSSYLDKPENSATGKWNSYLELDKINKLVADGKYKKAHKSILNLPEEIRNERTFQIIDVQIASQLDKKTFDAAFNNYIAQFPENPGKYLIPLDGLMLHNEYNQALDCIGNIDKNIKTDPLLDLLRAKIYYLLNDYESAIVRLSTLIERKPEFENGYFSLLSIYMEQKKYSEATCLLDNIINTFQIYKEDLQPLLKEYPDFLNSIEYKNWIGLAQAN